METKKWSPAIVPDEEFNKTNLSGIPTVDEILKQINKFSGRTSHTEFLSDVFRCGAYAISNRFDKSKYKEREEDYKRIISKYNSKDQELIAEIFANIYLLLSNQINIGFADYLGQIYMSSSTSNNKTGQFFTPYNVSKLCSELTITDNSVKKAIDNDEILTMHEPTCGSGGMILALADTLYNKYHFNTARNLFVECGDIDIRCVHMAYLQLSLVGIPAIIYHRNGLTLETWDKFETPAYIMQYHRFAKFSENRKGR